MSWSILKACYFWMRTDSNIRSKISQRYILDWDGDFFYRIGQLWRDLHLPDLNYQINPENMKFRKHVTFEWGPIKKIGQKKLHDICWIERSIFFFIDRLSLGIDFTSSNILRRIIDIVSSFQYRFHLGSTGSTLDDRFEPMWYYVSIPRGETGWILRWQRCRHKQSTIPNGLTTSRFQATQY